MQTTSTDSTLYSTTTGTNGTGGTVGPTTPGTVAPNTTTVTPGVPNTGVGGDLAMNIMLLVISAGIAIGGLVYFVRSFKTS